MKDLFIAFLLNIRCLVEYILTRISPNAIIRYEINMMSDDMFTAERKFKMVRKKDFKEFH